MTVFTQQDQAAKSMRYMALAFGLYQKKIDSVEPLPQHMRRLSLLFKTLLETVAL